MAAHREHSSPAIPMPAAVTVVDSHTEGEPTRVITGGWPELAAAGMAARREELRRRHDHLRRAVVCEPRGHDAVVGALLTPPVEAGSAAGPTGESPADSAPESSAGFADDSGAARAVGAVG